MWSDRTGVSIWILLVWFCHPITPCMWDWCQWHCTSVLVWRHTRFVGCRLNLVNINSVCDVKLRWLFLDSLVGHLWIGIECRSPLGLIFIAWPWLAIVSYLIARNIVNVCYDWSDNSLWPVWCFSHGNMIFQYSLCFSSLWPAFLPFGPESSGPAVISSFLVSYLASQRRCDHVFMCDMC